MMIESVFIYYELVQPHILLFLYKILLFFQTLLAVCMCTVLFMTS